MVGEYAYRRDRIFKYISVMDKNVSVPTLKDEDSHKLTLYLELDDILLHTFICDENLGYLSAPSAKDPEYEFLVPDINEPCLVFMRDHFKEFMDYLRDNKDMIDPIVYT